MREEAKWWIDDAYRALDIAKANYAKKFYEVTVFYCQQALEKLFKGCIIAFKKVRPNKIHKLIILYNKLERICPLSEDLTDFLHTITPYYYITRYPDVAMGLPIGVVTKSFAKECIDKTERVFKCFEKKL